MDLIHEARRSDRVPLSFQSYPWTVFDLKPFLRTTDTKTNEPSDSNKVNVHFENVIYMKITSTLNNYSHPRNKKEEIGTGNKSSNGVRPMIPSGVLKERNKRFLPFNGKISFLDFSFSC